MQNREVPLGSLPIFFSSLRLAEAGRSRPEVRGGDRARNAGYRLRNAEDGGTGTGRGVRGAGAEHGRRGRGAQDAKRGTRGRGRGHGGTGCRTQDAGRRTRATGRGQQNTGNGGTKCRRRKTRARGAGRRTRATGRGQQNTGNAGTGRRRRGIGDGAQAPVHGPQRDCIHPPGPATTCRGRSQPGAIRRRDQSAGTFHGWTPAAGTRNNPPGPFTAGRHPPPGPATTRRGRPQPGAIRHRDLQQPAGAVHSRAPSAAGRRYLSRVRIRITPLPPRTPYMLLPRCTSTDLTS